VVNLKGRVGGLSLAAENAAARRPRPAAGQRRRRRVAGSAGHP
jgi:hypothetical protein